MKKVIIILTLLMSIIASAGCNNKGKMDEDIYDNEGNTNINQESNLPINENNKQTEAESKIMDESINNDTMNTQDDNRNNTDINMNTVDLSVYTIMEQIKEQVKNDLIQDEHMKQEDFPNHEMIPGYMEMNLKDGEDLMVPLEIDQALFEEGILFMAMMNIKSDEIIVLKAVDEASVEALKKSLENEKQAQIGIWQTYLPEQFEKVQNNIIKVNGRYLLYVTYEYPERIEEVFDTMTK